MGGFGMGPGILVLAVILIAAYFLFVRKDGGGARDDRRDSLEILKRRLASGEISVEEFDTLRKYL